MMKNVAEADRIFVVATRAGLAACFMVLAVIVQWTWKNNERWENI